MDFPRSLELYLSGRNADPPSVPPMVCVRTQGTWQWLFHTEANKAQKTKFEILVSSYIGLKQIREHQATRPPAPPSPEQRKSARLNPVEEVIAGSQPLPTQWVVEEVTPPASPRGQEEEEVPTPTPADDHEEEEVIPETQTPAPEERKEDAPETPKPPTPERTTAMAVPHNSNIVESPDTSTTKKRKISKSSTRVLKKMTLKRLPTNAKKQQCSDDGSSDDDYEEVASFDLKRDAKRAKKSFIVSQKTAKATASKPPAKPGRSVDYLTKAEYYLYKEMELITPPLEHIGYLFTNPNTGNMYSTDFANAVKVVKEALEVERIPTDMAEEIAEWMKEEKINVNWKVDSQYKRDINGILSIAIVGAVVDQGYSCGYSSFSSNVSVPVVVSDLARKAEKDPKDPHTQIRFRYVRAMISFLFKELIKPEHGVDKDGLVVSGKPMHPHQYQRHMKSDRKCRAGCWSLDWVREQFSTAESKAAFKRDIAKHNESLRSVNYEYALLLDRVLPKYRDTLVKHKKQWRVTKDQFVAEFNGNAGKRCYPGAAAVKGMEDLDF